MPETNYKPSVGEKIFVSLSGNAPLLITVTGFHDHAHLKEEVMLFDRLDGSSTWASYKDQTFYPEIPADTPYLYFLVLEVDDGYDFTNHYDEAFFFTPQEAFAHRDAIVRGEIQSRHAPLRGEPDYIVEVRQVT